MLTGRIDLFELLVERDVNAGSDQIGTCQAEQGTGGGPRAGGVLPVSHCYHQCGQDTGSRSQVESDKARVDDGVVDGLHCRDAKLSGEPGKRLHREVGKDEEQS